MQPPNSSELTWLSPMNRHHHLEAAQLAKDGVHHQTTTTTDSSTPFLPTSSSCIPIHSTGYWLHFFFLVLLQFCVFFLPFKLALWPKHCLLLPYTVHLVMGDKLECYTDYYFAPLDCAFFDATSSNLFRHNIGSPKKILCPIDYLPMVNYGHCCNNYPSLYCVLSKIQ